jgi:hypothetical protein
MAEQRVNQATISKGNGSSELMPERQLVTNVHGQWLLIPPQHGEDLARPKDGHNTFADSVTH